MSGAHPSPHGLRFGDHQKANHGVAAETRVLLLATCLTCTPLLANDPARASPALPVASAAYPTAATPGSISAQPLAPGAAPTPGPLFRLLAPAQTGIDFVYHWNTHPRYARLLNSSVVGGGVCTGDYDGDGRPDLCLTRPAGGLRLYRNQGGFRFTEVTASAGVQDDSRWATGASFVDVNNDGRLDLYVCGYEAANRLYLNQGNGTFIEQAAAWGLDFNGASMSVAFTDYDRDGRLDAYLLTAGLMPGPTQKFRVNFVKGRPVVPPELAEYWQIFYLPGDRAAMAEAGQRDHLFRQEPNQRFRDVSADAGIEGCDFGNAAVWWDANHDGWPDLYVANDYFGPDRLYLNQRDGTFTNLTAAALPYTPWTSMGADIADFNNDGLLDLIASDMSGTTRFKRFIDSGDLERSAWFLEYPEPRQYLRNALFLNTGALRFLEAAQMAGLAHTDWTWSIVCGDLDLDGREDVFVPNGMTRDWMDNDLALESKGLSPADHLAFWERQPVRRDPNLAFRNLGDLQFTNVAAPWGLDHPGPTFGAALADLDGDGRLDLVVNDFAAPARVYRNAAPTGHRLTVRLRGSASNRFGVGAVVRLTTPSHRQLRYVTLTRGFMSATEPIAHFGTASDTRVLELTVEWPSGHRQSFKELAVDHAYVIAEPAEPPPPPPAPPPPTASTSGPPSTSTPPTLFQPSRRFAGLRHEALPMDEFQSQPLLPWKTSMSTPSLAWADLDADGAPEFYLSGSPHQPGALLQRTGDGPFQPRPVLGPNTLAEELAVLFLKANPDDHPDLLILDAQPSARLLLNAGDGRFTPAAADGLPQLSEPCGTAAVADFDRDGDSDLFLGGRSLPGRYPLPAPSHLWRNNAGRFHDVTAELAPALSSVGRVTAAVWSDTNQDGWVDLMLATEWGPVRLFLNEQGRLVERTREASLTHYLGWWTGLAAADLDHDGDVDYLVGNLGLNSLYQPSAEAPCRLYYGRFGGNPDAHLIEAVVTRDGLFPVRGKTALEKAAPNLAERFPKHRDYAAATLPELLGTNALNQAFQLEVNTAETGVLLNDGQARFRFLPLPRAAQLAPTFGIGIADFNGDAHPDAFLAQNFSGPHRETGRITGSVAWLLLGRGDGRFDPVWPEHSGVVIPEDARSVSTLDFTSDGRPDLLVTTHNGELRAFENQVAPPQPRPGRPPEPAE